MKRWLCLFFAALLGFGAQIGLAEERRSSQCFLAHYMPWFEVSPAGPRWGWHWTMNAVDPGQIVNGLPRIAAHAHPLIGPYDSGDAAVLEYHLLTMKLAGIDGVIVDWYGLQDFRDYALLHRNTVKLIEQVEKLGMKFVICYEDQTVPALVEAGRLKPGERVSHTQREIRWMADHWFSLKSYVRLDDRPVLLSFGQTGLSDVEWSACLKALAPVDYFSLHLRRSAAVGAFDWPIPSQGRNAVERFQRDARSWPRSIPVVYPRFVDFYSEAKVGPSYGRIEDRAGTTFRELLDQAITSQQPVVQIATWNDWGEGTIIEPSHEYQFRDLETIWQVRPSHSPAGIARKPEDLRLPLRLLGQRQAARTPEEIRTCDTASQRLASGRLAESEQLLSP